MGFKVGVFVSFSNLTYIYNKHEMEIVISSSTNKHKKYDAVVDGEKKISFGASGFSDFFKHGDTDRKDRYIARHKKMRITG